MMDDVGGLFTTIIVVQLFFSLAITLISHTLPDDSLQYVDVFVSTANTMDIQDIGEEIQGSLDKQTNIPIIELGALVFYSGNILIDLLLNFLFAIPQMFELLLTGILYFAGGLNNFVIVSLQIFIKVLISALYLFGIIKLITNIRTGRAI